MVSSFDEVSQEWLIRFVEHRVGDKRIIRLIRKWLKAGILEDGVVAVSDKGTGQGSVISPLLANIYLHYVLDLWAERWRRREATGDMIMVRYADDLIVGFEREADAGRFLEAMRERLREFALSLHPDKTRLIEFGRFAAANRERRGLGKPETFNFLGFTFICGKSRLLSRLDSRRVGEGPPSTPFRTVAVRIAPAFKLREIHESIKEGSRFEIPFAPPPSRPEITQFPGARNSATFPPSSQVSSTCVSMGPGIALRRARADPGDEDDRGERVQEAQGDEGDQGVLAGGDAGDVGGFPVAADGIKEPAVAGVLEQAEGVLPISFRRSRNGPRTEPRPMWRSRWIGLRRCRWFQP